MPVIDVPTVHAVTDAQILAHPRFVALAAGILRALGSRVAVHLRGRELPSRALWQIAMELAPVQERTGGWLVVNDRVDLAAATGARGAQLTAGSLLLADARRVSGQVALGASVHDMGETEAAAGAGADWLLAGHIFPTPSHAAATPAGLAFLANAARVHARTIAIGGVTPDRLDAIRASGAFGAAAIRGIWHQPDPVAAAARYVWT